MTNSLYEMNLQGINSSYQYIHHLDWMFYEYNYHDTQQECLQEGIGHLE